MTRLQQAISRIQRREGPRLGFGAPSRERPRAMLAAALANDGKAIPGLIEAGADLVLVEAANAAAYASATSGAEAGEVVLGALLPALDGSAAAELKEAGCDFVVSPLAETASVAIDPDGIGVVIRAPGDASDATLRAIGPLGLEGMYLEVPAATLALPEQLGLVRLASLTSTPLIAAVGGVPEVPDLRVLRDSGVAAIVLPAAAGVKKLTALVNNLKAVPAPNKSRRERGGEAAFVPSIAPAAEPDSDEPDDE